MTPFTPLPAVRRHPVTAFSAAVPLVGQVVTWADTRSGDTAFSFVDYASDPAGITQSLTWSELHARAAALAIRLGQVAAPGDRVAVLAPSGLEYVVGLVATWYARMVAVPLFPPDLPGHEGRLAASFDDCAPTCVLTTTPSAEAVHAFVGLRAGERAILRIDDRSDEQDALLAARWTPPSPGADEVAYLQYTSGSTRTPAGVEITYRNVAANVAQLLSAFVSDRPGITAVSWLPLFHDMGLLLSVAVPLLSGGQGVIFDPVAFLMQPVRWLQLLSHRPDACTAAPNFAYDYVLRRLRPEQLADLDLRGVFTFLNGAEPIRTETMAAFPRALASTGLDPRVLRPAYGLAEATVFVSGGVADQPATAIRFDRASLAAGDGQPARDGEAATTLVSCGVPGGQVVVAVDPLGRALPEGRVGEIWVHGPNVARRYWGQPERSAEVFQATLIEPPPSLPAGPWLRTGDLGLLRDGELYVTGRLKDLLIVAGRNHYPQDIEATVADTVQGLAAGRVAAFSVPVEAAERAVIVCEHSRSAHIDGWDPARISRAVRVAVWNQHGLAVHDVVTTTAGRMPRTSSGKLSRSACRELYLFGGFEVAAPPHQAMSA